MKLACLGEFKVMIEALFVYRGGQRIFTMCLYWVLLALSFNVIPWIL